MKNKLTFRNAKRSSKDYFIYLVTLTIVVTLMVAFNSMVFSRDMKEIYGEQMLFIVFIGLATVFIVVIVIWLIHYIVIFMMERRSREFGTYMLLGMEKKKIASMFRNENLILGMIAMVLGIIPGYFFKIIFIHIFYSVLEVKKKISMEFSGWGVLLSFGIILFAYFLALIRVKKRFKKMNIRDLIYMDKENETIGQDKGLWKRFLVLIAVIYIVYFHILVFTGRINILNIWVCIIALIVSIYLLYIGLSSYLISFIKKKKKVMYKDANVFVIRQLASKIKTMRFTMGTLTILFTCALLGWTVVIMFGDYQKNELENSMPFDIVLFSDKVDETFAEQKKLIYEKNEVLDSYQYNIFRTEDTSVNDYLFKNVGNTWKAEPHPNGKWGYSSYYQYDTYIKLSDYNKIRSMLGYDPVDLKEGYYLFHGKERVSKLLEECSRLNEIQIGDETLVYQGIMTESLSQNGMNGADYLIVVPDDTKDYLTPFYALFIAEIKGEPSANLQNELKDLEHFEITDEDETLYDIAFGAGTNAIFSVSDSVLVSDIVSQENGFIIVSMCFMLAYLGIIFLCVALTILSIQQLSDATKFRFRYGVLFNLGLSKDETRKVVKKQLALYFISPFAISVVLSMFIGLLASERFVYYTGVSAGIFQYYIQSLLVFGVLYAVYFTVTYISFIRNIEK